MQIVIKNQCIRNQGLPSQKRSENFSTGFSGLQNSKKFVTKQTSLGQAFFLQNKFLSKRVLIAHRTYLCQQFQFHSNLSPHSVKKKHVLLLR